MWKLKNRHNNKGFTFIELMVTMGIIGVLSGIGVIALSKITATNQQTKCVNNLREISQGLQLYHNDFRTFPDDGYPDYADDLYPLSTDLAIYVPTKSIFVCPEDEDTTSISDFASYDPYYVARPASYQNGELVIGCPRHRDASNSTSLFSMGSTEITDIDIVKTNGLEIPADGTKAQRTISAVNDVMEFADGSTVTLTNASGGDYGCFLIQSVRLADGTLYSIVRVQDDGTIDVSVNQGSKFEIVTPSAVVGVRGTKFDVVTTDGGNTTYVNLTEGTVILMDSVTGETTTLTVGGITTASAAIQTHTHPHWHADGTYHKHDVNSPHPSLNLAHHGNPALAMKVVADTGGGEIEGEVDADGDGYDTSTDCDDNDADVNPGATEILDNGIDDDCNPATSDISSGEVDNDNDGYDTSTDCDDNDRLVNPGATEILDNGKDDDCDPLTLDSSADQILVDYINDLANTSSDVKTELWANTPLSDAVLMAMLNRNPSMDGADIEYLLVRKAGARTNVPVSETVLIEAVNLAIMDSAQYDWVLVKNEPVSDNVLIAAIDKGTIMLENHYYDVFWYHKPLSENVLNVLVNKEQDPPLMNSSYYTDTLKDSSPLAQSILDQICAGKPTAMEAGDQQTVLDANSYACP